jgi:DNA-binding NarL/FixJ family response regulator
MSNTTKVDYHGPGLADRLKLHRGLAVVTATSATLIIADDHPLFRAALREAVSRLLPGATIIEAGSLGSLEEAVQAHPSADLLLLDLYMPGARGFSALIQLRAQYPSIPIAIVSAAEEPAMVRRALDFGASGFIPKSASIEKIGAMLRAVLDGQVALPPGYVQQTTEANRPDREAARQIASLTPQQLRVLLLLADGYPNKAIATDLGVSEATVKAHVTIILRKLGLERRTQAALLAQRFFQVESYRANGDDARSGNKTVD